MTGHLLTAGNTLTCEFSKLANVAEASGGLCRRSRQKAGMSTEVPCVLGLSCTDVPERDKTIYRG